MKKEESIKMFQDAYLEGKGEQARAAFFAKSVAKQYSCIMAWRHRMRHSNKTTDGSEIIDHLRMARRRLNGATEITEQELRTVDNELAALRDGAEVFRTNRKAREIEELEQQQAQILQRLRMLKENPDQEMH